MQTLLDREALRELAARYARAVDRRDFALLRALYHDAAVHDHGSMFLGGPDAFVTWLEASMGDMVTQHIVANTLFDIAGDEAEGEIYTVNYHVMDGGRDYIAGGRYLDRYVRHEGRWLFMARKRVIDWTHERARSEGGVSAGLVRGALGRSDASFAFLPRLSVFR